MTQPWMQHFYSLNRIAVFLSKRRISPKQHQPYAVSNPEYRHCIFHHENVRRNFVQLYFDEAICKNFASRKLDFSASWFSFCYSETISSTKTYDIWIPQQHFKDKSELTLSILQHASQTLLRAVVHNTRRQNSYLDTPCSTLTHSLTTWYISYYGFTLKTGTFRRRDRVQYKISSTEEEN